MVELVLADRIRSYKECIHFLRVPWSGKGGIEYPIALVNLHSPSAPPGTTDIFSLCHLELPFSFSHLYLFNIWSGFTIHILVWRKQEQWLLGEFPQRS